MANELLKGIGKLALAILGFGTAAELGNKAIEDRNEHKKLSQNNNAQ